MFSGWHSNSISCVSLTRLLTTKHFTCPSMLKLNGRLRGGSCECQQNTGTGIQSSNGTRAFKKLSRPSISVQFLTQLVISSKKESATVSTEVVLVDGIPFPPQVTPSANNRSLSLLGHGITDIEIHFLQIKFTAIGVYLDPEIVTHLQQWKGKKGTDLAEDDDFFEAIISAPVDKFLRIVVIKEIKGSQYGVQLESAVRDRLAADDKYEDEEEAALEEVVEFFQPRYFKKDSILTFYFPATSSAPAEITFTTEGKEESKIKVENANVVEMIQKWYLGGTRGLSQTTISSLANTLSAELSK